LVELRAAASGDVTNVSWRGPDNVDRMATLGTDDLSHRLRVRRGGSGRVDRVPHYRLPGPVFALRRLRFGALFLRRTVGHLVLKLGDHPGQRFCRCSLVAFPKSASASSSERRWSSAISMLSVAMMLPSAPLGRRAVHQT